MLLLVLLDAAAAMILCLLLQRCLQGQQKIGDWRRLREIL
jgi:hypothetical protein